MCLNMFMHDGCANIFSYDAVLDYLLTQTKQNEKPNLTFVLVMLLTTALTVFIETLLCCLRVNVLQTS